MFPIDGLRVIIEPFIFGSVDTSRPLLDLDLSIFFRPHKNEEVY